MLDKQDIKILRDMFGEMLGQNNVTLTQDIKRDMRDEMHALLAATEQRLRRDIHLDFAEFLDDRILPQIAELQTDMIMVKQHLNLA